MKKSILSLLSCLFLSGCLGVPESVVPVSDFKVQNYLGRWYEIARLDHPFERGLSNISAEYRMNSEGDITVTNCGFSEEKNSWKDVHGKIGQVGSPSTGHLKVSFFGPFYGSYVIFGLDQDNYQYAYVSGPNKDYLWFLSRTPTVSEQSYQQFVDRSAALGFDTSQLIRVQQSGAICPQKG